MLSFNFIISSLLDDAFAEFNLSLRYFIWKSNAVNFLAQHICCTFRLIIKSNFHTYILTQLNYLNWIFWLNLNTQVESSDLTWYQLQVRVRFKFSTQLVKQSNMTLRELNIEIFPVFRLCITFLHYLFGRKS